MPMIRVEMFAGRTAEQKRALAKALTEAFTSTCGGTVQSVHIVIDDVAKGGSVGKVGRRAQSQADADPHGRVSTPRWRG